MNLQRTLDSVNHMQDVCHKAASASGLRREA
jgi:hypothetical protein